MGPPALLLALAILATLSWAGDALDMKLTAQFARFDAAKATLAERTGRQGQEIDRDTWEQLLKPPPAEQLAPAELHELHDRHLAEAAAARESARKKSAIDLDRFRTNRNEVMRFCQKFPKGGLLHVHPTGVISPESAKGILSRTNPRIDSGLAYFARQSGAKGVEFLDHLKPTPFNDLTEDQKTRIARMVQTPDAAPGSPVRLSMNDFDGYFPFIKTVLQKSADDFDPVYQSYVDFLKRARSQGVTYVELTKGFVVAPDSLQRVKVLSERLLKDTGVIVRWNLAFNRLDGPGTFRSQAQELSKLVASSPGATMVGIDLIGNEDGTPAFDRAQTLYAPLLDGEKNHGSRHDLQFPESLPGVPGHRLARRRDAAPNLPAEPRPADFVASTADAPSRTAQRHARDQPTAPVSVQEPGGQSESASTERAPIPRPTMTSFGATARGARPTIVTIRRMTIQHRRRSPLSK